MSGYLQRLTVGYSTALSARARLPVLRPAGRSGSPVAQADQRLHDVDPTSATKLEPTRPSPSPQRPIATSAERLSEEMPGPSAPTQPPATTAAEAPVPPQSPLGEEENETRPSMPARTLSSPTRTGNQASESPQAWRTEVPWSLFVDQAPMGAIDDDDLVLVEPADSPQSEVAIDSTRDGGRERTGVDRETDGGTRAMPAQPAQLVELHGASAEEQRERTPQPLRAAAPAPSLLSGDVPESSTHAPDMPRGAPVIATPVPSAPVVAPPAVAPPTAEPARPAPAPGSSSTTVPTTATTVAASPEPPRQIRPLSAAQASVVGPLPRRSRAVTIAGLRRR